jgi:phage baseplate assembly protein gpV
VTSLIPMVRAIIREELTRYRLPELGVVSSIFAMEDEGSDGNHQVNVRLRGSGLEVQRAAVAVDRAGWSALPREGDLVVVAYLDGDLNAPIVLGTVYDNTLRPPKAGPLELVYQPTDQADSSVRRLYIELPTGSSITYDDDKLTISSGDTEVVVEKDGDVSIKSAGNVKIESQGDINLEAGGNVNVKAQQNLSMQGMQVTLEGQASSTVKAPTVSINGITSFNPS